MSVLGLCGCYEVDDLFRRLEEWDSKLHDPKFIVEVWYKVTWVKSGAKDADEIIARINSTFGNLKEVLQLCGLFAPREKGINSLIIDFVKRALIRDRDKATVREDLLAERLRDQTTGGRIFIQTDAISGTEMCRFDDDNSSFTGCILEKKLMFPERIKDDAIRLARLLAEGPGRGCSELVNIAIPRCHGIHNNYLVLEPPVLLKPNVPYATLRSLLITRQHMPPPLSARLRLAIDLAHAVLIIHSLGLVHKTINPETILVLPGDDCSPVTLGRPCLIGFGSVRSDDVILSDRRNNMIAHTSVENILHTMLYKHPKHWVEDREEAYEMRDDIYSLGVCLLEIALWKSFFHFDLGSTSIKNDEQGMILVQPRDTGEEFNGDLDNVGKEWKRKNQELLLNIANNRIPSAMGDIFRDVVVNCLSCWERPHGELADDSLYIREVDKGIWRYGKEAKESLLFSENVVSKLVSINL